LVKFEVLRLCFRQYKISTFGSAICQYLTSPIRGKYFHFCIGRAQPIHCAMTKQTTAVAHLYVRPAQTITFHVNPPIDTEFDYCVCSLLQKSGSLAKGTNKSRRMFLNV